MGQARAREQNLSPDVAIRAFDYARKKDGHVEAMALTGGYKFAFQLSTPATLPGISHQPTQTAMDSSISDFTSLVELFNKLANRPVRPTAKDDSELDDLRNVSVPPEFQNVVRNLSSLIAPRANTEFKPAAGVTKGRPRRNTVAVSAISPRTVTPEPSIATQDNDIPLPNPFPIEGQQFPFTFKMMLHKLYELDDWEKKVKDVLSQSRSQFKPLALVEDHPVRPVDDKANSTPKVHFAAGLGHPNLSHQRRNIGSVPSRHRSVSMGGDIPKLSAKDAKVLLRDDARAVKKRCVGRRKSYQEAFDSENGIARRSPGLWVYEAAAVSVDTSTRDSYRRRAGEAPMANSTWDNPTTTRPHRSKTVSDVRGGLIFQRGQEMFSV